MSAIRKELMDAAKMDPKRGEDDATFLIRLQKAISEEIDEATWAGLSEKAQDWNNDAADAITAGKSIPPFPDETAAAPAPAPSRRRGATAEPEQTVAYDPKKGDEVEVTTKRGKLVAGFIVELDAEVIVLNPEANGPEAKDIELPLPGSVVKPMVGAGLTKAAVDPKEPEEPEIGDTVAVITARDKNIVGLVVELSAETMVLKDSTGEEHELGINRLKSVLVKGKPAAAPAPAASGRRGAAAPAPAPAAGEKAKRASNPAGVSVGQRINEMVIDNPAMKVEEIGAALKKEGLEFRDNTLGMTFSSAHKFLDLLRARKLFK